MVLPESDEKIYCSGILGAIQLVTGFYLILITKKQNIGSLLKKEVLRLKEIKIITIFFLYEIIVILVKMRI